MVAVSAAKNVPVEDDHRNAVATEDYAQFTRRTLPLSDLLCPWRRLDVKRSCPTPADTHARCSTHRPAGITAMDGFQSSARPTGVKYQVHPALGTNRTW
jgi:hypothetical protein